MYKPGKTVIVTQDDVNRVGVVLDEYKVNKQTVYDVLLENRSAMCMIGTAPKSNTRINRTLTQQLCNEDNTTHIINTIPYKSLVDNEMLPFTKS
jgi:hypothetical protein|tara:strand:- start:1667 stop:1948 length:282 start_codon:yes stop_codon:yes gene_type:complete